MTGLLDGKVAFITGSGRGQGLAAAHLFASEGASVVVNDLDDVTVKSAVEEITAAGGKAVGTVADVSSADDVQRALAEGKQAFGGIDILYNNAGIGFSAKERMGIDMTDLVSCTEDDWLRILDINLGGVYRVCKYGIPLLVERGGGSIVNTASIAAITGGPSAHAYVASKGGVVSLTRAIAKTWGKDGIRANTICPGVIDTEMIQSTMLSFENAREVIGRGTPVGRIGTPDDIAQMALFLASDKAGFITGQTIAVDGGATA